MFEFFFKYPVTVFSKGTFVLLGGWPAWLLALMIVAAGLALGAAIWMRRRRIAPSMRGVRSVAVWLLQTTLLALLLVLLWQPAMSVATLKPQQNIVAVVVDDSKSMAAEEEGSTRIEKAVKTLNSGLIKNLNQKFQVRLYRLGDRLERIPAVDGLKGTAPATHIGSGLRDLLADTATLPVGAIVLLSDGADNSGGIDLETFRRSSVSTYRCIPLALGANSLRTTSSLPRFSLPAGPFPIRACRRRLRSGSTATTASGRAWWREKAGRFSAAGRLC